MHRYMIDQNYLAGELS